MNHCSLPSSSRSRFEWPRSCHNSQKDAIENHVIWMWLESQLGLLLGSMKEQSSCKSVLASQGFLGETFPNCIGCPDYCLITLSTFPTKTSKSHANKKTEKRSYNPRYIYKIYINTCLHVYIYK